MMGEHDEGAEVGGVRNADLCDKFRAYCQVAITMLNNKLDESGDARGFVASVPGFTLKQNGSVELADTEETNWRGVVSRWREEVAGTEQSPSVHQALRDDETIAGHLDRPIWIPGSYMLSPGSDIWVEEFLTSLLYQGGGRFQDAVFDSLYGRMEAFFYEDQLELRILAPVGGFEMEGDLIEFERRLRIVRLTQADVDRMAQFWASPFGGLLLRKPWIGKRRWGFELYLRMPKQMGGGGQEAHQEAWKHTWHSLVWDRFEEACSALRVYRKGDMWYDFYLGDFTSWHPRNAPLFGGDMNLRQLFYESYTLSEEATAELVEFSKGWGKAKHWQDLEVAVHRFSLGCERSSPVDRLIDYVIALEALLLPDEKTGEYRYRLSLRGAALLGKDPLDRAAIKRNLAEAYDTRSSIVHGSKEKLETVGWRKKPDKGEKLATEDVAFRDFVDYISDYVRALIQELGRQVEKKKLVRVLQDDIDDAIAKGFATPKQS